MFHNLPLLIESKEVHSDILLVPGPNLMSMQGNQITCGNCPNEFDLLIRILSMHLIKVGDESIFAVSH